MSRVIDVMHLGRERVICAYEIDGWIVDPGPSSCVETLLEGLAGEAPRGLLLTHIHLDHAGASGVLARRFPGLPVYVHERGAPHLADPSKLLASATQLYGDDMDRLWGEVIPVPEENLRVVSGGETVDGFRVTYTPGHASHHVSYLHEETGDAFVGDVAGVHIPPSIVTVPPTPPPDIDIEKWLGSLDAIEALAPRRLCLTHFGHEYAVADQFDTMRHALRTWAQLAAESGQEKFVAELQGAVRENADPDTAAAFFQAAPPDQLYLGLARYWAKKAEKEAVR
jgi:glyoxylase-like metal-dependent hydrolase (beta-lactamase superfamily II)